MLRIRLDPDMVSKLKSSRLERYDDVAVVIRIESFEKTALEIYPNGEEVDFTMGDSYVVTGVCIDFLPLK